jgi:ketosteroid isomerase-like protein
MPPLTPEHTATQKVASRLAELCTAGKYTDAIKELYADNARHIEVIAAPGCDRLTEGKQTLLEKADKFAKTTTVHSSSVGKPIVNGDQFICPMSLDATSGEGPMAGQRMNMVETALYTVKNGKITEGKFFYPMGM